MTKKEVIQHEILLKQLEELKIDNEELRDIIVKKENQVNKLFDLSEKKILNTDEFQKRERLYLTYLKNIESNFIYRLFFNKKHLELFKQLKNIYNGN